MAKRKSSAKPGKDQTPPQPQTEDREDELVVVAASDVKPRPVEWLWEGRLEKGTTAFIQGGKAAGKSTWLRAMAAYCTGGPILPGMKGRRKAVGNVLYFAGEQALESIVIPGLKAAGADMKKVHCSDRQQGGGNQLRLTRDCERLARLIKKLDVALVVIDPIFCFLDSFANLEGPTTPIRDFMGEVADVAADTRAVILMARNITKGPHKSALDAGRGGGELGNAARSVLHADELPCGGQYALAVVHANAAATPPAIVYRFQGKGDSVVTEFVGWSSITADELAGGEDAELERNLLDHAKSIIKQMLKGGEVNSKSVKMIGEGCMISARTMMRAAKELGVEKRRTGSRDSTQEFWSTPKGGWPVLGNTEPPKKARRPRKTPGDT